jgi:hypothetical protein
MSDDIKPAVLSEGDGAVPRRNESQEGDVTGVFDRLNPGAVPPDHDDPNADSNVEAPSRGATSPDIEADPGDDPQAPNKKGEG